MPSKRPRLPSSRHLDPELGCSMIIVITTQEEDPRTGRMRVVTSHGIDERTGKNVILPGEPPEALGAVFDPDLHEYIIRDEEPPASPAEGLKAEPKDDWFGALYGSAPEGP